MGLHELDALEALLALVDQVLQDPLALHERQNALA
jgi:hypothetical protein